jgi:hypothetical protein
MLGNLETIVDEKELKGDADISYVKATVSVPPDSHLNHCIIYHTDYTRPRSRLTSPKAYNWHEPMVQRKVEDGCLLFNKASGYCHPKTWSIQEMP